jgi:hypothetical protein
MPSENAIKWTLFGLMTATIPVLYYMLVIGGFMPLIAIVAVSFNGPWGFVLFNAIHLLVYGTLFYWLAKFISQALALLPPGWRLAGFASVSAALVAVAFLPVYGIEPHQSQPVDLYRFLRGLFTQGFS